MAATRELRAAADLRFGQVGIANVRVHDADPAALQQALELRLREAPALFTRAPVIVDLSFLDTLPADADVAGLFDAVRAAGMLPVGLAYGDSATDALSHRLGVPLIAKFRAGHAPAAAADAGAPGPAAAHPAPTAGTPATAVQHLQPVRSGQQVYAQGTDLIVTGTVANGAEVLADGNIHVYGALRGRAFAGVGGDASTRIFCSEFRAEIVSIAGHYRVFEELPPAFAGHAVQIHLAAGTLAIEPL